jgi:hypothetical protein
MFWTLKIERWCKLFAIFGSRKSFWPLFPKIGHFFQTLVTLNQNKMLAGK